MRTQLYAVVSAAFFATACNADKDSKQTPGKRVESSNMALYQKDTFANRFHPNYSLSKSDTSNIWLDFFDTIPETISNTGEFYTYDTTKIAEKRYIFLTNLTEYAIIKINNKDVYLLKDYDKCIALPANTFKDVFSGNGFTIIFIHKGDSKDGVSYETGTLDIQNSKHQALFKIHGGYKL